MRGHQISAVYIDAAVKTASGREQLRVIAPDVRFREDWESLLLQTNIDAVIVAESTGSPPADVREAREDRLRKLVQAKVPLLVIPPACEGIVGFELEMIRRDLKGIVVPAIANSLHPAWAVLKEQLRQHEADIALWEHRLEARDREHVLAALARDVAILSLLVGPLRRVTATGASREDAQQSSLANLVVSLDSESSLPARWSVEPAGSAMGDVLRIRGSDDWEVSLQMPVDAAWGLTTSQGAQTFEPFDARGSVIEQLENELRGIGATGIAWMDACRAVEAMEAAVRSLERGRTIELYNEEHSEESSFRGVMAASGCLLLMTTLAAFIGVAVLAAVFRPRNAGEGFWSWLQVCLVAPIGVFLLLQLLAFGLTAHRRNKQLQVDEAAKSVKQV